MISAIVPGALVLSVIGPCARPDDDRAAPPEFEVEYRQVSKLPTCVGNRRIKVNRDARVYAAVNTTECPRGEQWSAPYPASPARTLSDAERRHLLGLIQSSGFLELAPRYPGDRDDGFREEIEVTVADRHQSVVVEQRDPPAFTRVRQALLGAAR
jgi:hypothetical protein